MGVVKVIVNGETKVDLTPTTTEASEVNAGEVFFNRSGEQDVGTGDPPSTRVPVYGMGENLLRNWYFVGGGIGRGIFPVNQRGGTTYTGNGYHMDGWINYNNPTLTLGADGVTISGTNIAQYANLMRQSIANPENYRGVTLTLSVLMENATAGIYVAINDGSAHLSSDTVAGTNLLKVTWTVGSSATALSVNFHNRTAGASLSFKLIAAKLEVGTEQTLCHQENSTWVLNEIPDYEEELIRCQTSTGDPDDLYANKVVATNVSNPNLFRNWYFVGSGTGKGVFPINQRGQNSYTKSASGSIETANYCIDGWMMNRGTNTLTSTGMNCVWNGSTDYQVNSQIIPNYTYYVGKNVTMSVLTSDGTLYQHTYQVPASSSYISAAGPAIRFGFSPTKNAVYFTTANTSGITIVAAKLELGTQQTLCHQENGVWVLNEIPDYEEELIKCQTSTADSTDTYANKSLATEQQIASIETSNTASQAYHIGQYFCKDGLLYRVTAEISSGATFTVGTNCVSTTAATWLPQELAYNLTTNAKFTSLSGKVTRVGNTVILSFRGVASASISNNTEIIRIPYASPGSDGQILSMWRANTAYTCRINAGTISSVPNGRIYTNTAISANDNISITGIYFL